MTTASASTEPVLDSRPRLSRSFDSSDSDSELTEVVLSSQPGSLFLSSFKGKILTELFIDSYSVGDVVLCKWRKYPWWPAKVRWALSVC